MTVIARRGSRLVRNTVLNFFSQAIPLAVAVFSLPYTVHGLGAERFGMLSLAWVLVGYFGLFDLGLGRATTKFVAEAISRGEDARIPKIVWSSLAVQAVLGVTGGVLLAVATPFFAGRILKIPANSTGEMRNVLYLLAVSVPVIVGSRNLRGVLEAAQRFDLVNIVRIPFGMLTFLIPMAGALMHQPVSAIVFWLILLIAASSFAYLAYCFRIFPTLVAWPSIDRSIVPALLLFGGWVTISNILIPTLVYLDRLLIGALVSVEALTYYATPHEVASRLLIFPIALSTTLFPAFSALSALDWEDLKRLYVRSLKYVLVGLGPVAFLGAVYAGDVLRVWLGRDFAVKSTLVFQILSVGILLNALSLMPSNLLDSIGRPDVRAKLFLSYVLVYAIALWFLIARFGIVGAALAWALRGGAECLLFILVSAKMLRIGSTHAAEAGLPRAIIAYTGLVVMTLASVVVVHQRILQEGATVLWLALFSVIVWKYVLDDRERSAFAFAKRVIGGGGVAERLGA
jgi:O-antigen/teichoic acid export membrane protein